MNDTGYSLDVLEPPLTPIDININNKENLGTISVFISAILLSCGGFIAMMFSSLRSSRCVDVNCCGITCKRKIPVIDIESNET